jgi:HB1, ASXL, restriction endonuclease HTH domain
MAASKSSKKTNSKKAKKTQGEAKAPKLSALDAAAKVLAETGKPMSCNEMIEAMAAKGYWSSPGGKTPASTLYSAILKEISTKGKESRFRKTDRGQFARA